MAIDDFIIPRGTDQDERVAISRFLDGLNTRINNIVALLQLDPNVLTFGVGVLDDNPAPWTVAGGLVPLVDAGSAIGPNPPTIAADVITINSPGFYDINCVFALDIDSGGNTVTIEVYINGSDAQAITAGVEFSGGQAVPITQPTARAYRHFDAGDTVSFVATELGTGDKLLLYRISGGSVIQTAYDWDAVNP